MLTPKKWGYEDEIVNLEYCGKRMFVKEQYRCSIHHHKVKDEVLMVGNDEGVLYFEIGENPDDMTGVFMHASDRIRVKTGMWHRFTGIRDTYIYEFSTHHEDSDSHRRETGGKVGDDEFRVLLENYCKEENSDKVLTLEAASAISDALHREGRSIGMCNGCFDLLHLGHVSLLSEAKDRCDVLFVAVNSDDAVRRLKGDARPFIDQKGRLGMLASNRYTDYVVLCNGTTCLEVVDAVSPDVYVTTSEFGPKTPEAREVLANGGKVEVVGMIEGYNTTAIAREIRNRK